MSNEIREKTYNLAFDYNQTYLDETDKRRAILERIVNKLGLGCQLDGSVYFEFGSNTVIGKNFHAGNNFSVMDKTDVMIGDDCDFGANVTISTEMMDLTQGFAQKAVYIGNGCKIGTNVMICGGVCIGDGCVIGSGSVVVSDMPPGSCGCGNPCRVVGTLKNAEIIGNRK